MADSPRIEELRRRVESDPASIAFAALAEEYRRAGRYDEAIATCRQGLQRHPSYISAHVTLGRSLLEVGHFDEAREQLELVLRVAPENLAAIRGLAEIHHRQGETREAADFSATHFAGMTAPGPAAPPGDDEGRDEPEPPPAEVPPARPRIPVVTQVSVAPAQPLPVDPALERLEMFLQAIVRARETGQSIHPS